MPTNSKLAFDLEQALQECSQEPIHIPGSIQPMGFLLLYNLKNDRILALSQNTPEFTGKQTAQMLDKPLSTALGIKASARLRSSLHKSQLEETNNAGYKWLYKLNLNEREFVVFVNGPAHHLLIELEPQSREQVFSFFDFASNIQESLRWMFTPTEMPVEQVFGLALEELKGITGFDRIMLYKFDNEYNGQVISEALGSMDSFLGLHFPASDIPEQARKLYLKNWLRLISNVDYVPVPLVGKGPDQPAVDLSEATFRSVSPVHLQYLRNMGVGASMSVSIIVDGRLWGLIAMHHPQPLDVSPDKRAAAQYTGQLLSMFVGRNERQQVKERQTFIKSLESSILSLLIEDINHFYDALGEKQQALMALCEADGLLLIHQNNIRLNVGVLAEEKNIAPFVDWLDENVGKKLSYHCDRLPQDERVLGFLRPPLPGLLVVPLLGVPSYLIWFRNEQARNIKWGGKPQKDVEKTSEGTYRLSPRNSFESWEENISGKAIPWTPVDQDMAIDIGRSLALLQIRYLEKKGVLPIAREHTILDEYQIRDIERKTNILNEQFKTVVESSPDALAAIDNDNRFLILNPRYKEMFRDRFGKLPQIGDSLVDLLSHSPLALKKSLQFWEQVRQGKISNEEVSYRNRDGITIYTFNTYNKIYGEKGSLQGILATIRDITRTKETEREIRELYQKYKLLLQSVGPLTWIANAQGAFDYPQPAWEAFTGQALEDYEGYGWLDVMHEEDRERVRERWLHSVQTHQVFEIDVRVWNAREHFHENFVTYAIPIFNEVEEVKEWFGICISIQRLKEQEARLESALKALQTSNADLQHFAYVASHDLQEPLRMITGYLTLIEKRYSNVLDDRGREFMHFAVDGAHRMKRLIEELLTYSRVNRMEKYETVPLDAIFGQICQNFRLKIEEKKAIIHTPPLPEITGIPVQMYQLFTNLLSNALKFTRDDDFPEVRIGVESRKLSWQFTIQDNGIGIDPRYAERIFNIFFRLQNKHKYPGTGVGLAICQRVIANHGGKIWVDTEFQGGTKFVFTIRKHLVNAQS